MIKNTKLTKLEQQPLASDEEEEEEEDDSSSQSSSSSSEEEEEPAIATPSKKSSVATGAADVTSAATPTKRKRAAKGEKKKRKRRKKDPEAPKRPKTGYLRFCDEHRAEIQKKLNTTYVKEVSVVLGQMWKDLDPVEKAKYNESFKNDNELYHEQMKKYREDHPLPDFETSDESDSGKKKKKKDPNAPKTPLTGYMQFAKEHRNEIVTRNPDMKHTMVNKELGKMWKELTEEEREVYNVKYRDAKRQHEVAMRQYKEEHPSSSSSSEDEEESSKGKKKKKTTGKKKKDPKAPKAPPNSYNLYSASVRDGVKEKNPTLNHKQINRIVGQMWQDLPKEEKETFINQANAMRAEYLQKVQLYSAGKGKETVASSKKSSKTSADTSSGQRPVKGKQNVIASSDEDDSSDDESADEQSQDEQSGSEDESESSDSD